MQTRPRSPQIAPYRILPSIAKLSWIQLVMWSLHQGKQHKLWRARIVNTFQLHSFRTRFQPDRQLRRLWQRFLAGSLCRQFRPFSPNTTRDHRTDIFRGQQHQQEKKISQEDTVRKKKQPCRAGPHIGRFCRQYSSCSSLLQRSSRFRLCNLRVEARQKYA